MAKIDPLKAQAAYKRSKFLYELLYVAIVVGGTALLAVTGRHLGGGYLMAVIGISVLLGFAYVVYRLLYETQFGRNQFLEFTGVQVFCPECEKSIPRLGDWVCGYCDKENKEHVYRPIVYKCEHCDRAPKSVICWNCDSPVFFDSEHNIRNPARILGKSPMPSGQQADPVKEKEHAHQRRKIDLVHEIEITQLQAQLDRLKASTPYKQEVSAREKLEKEYSAHDADTLGCLMLAKEKRKEWDETLQDDPELREMKELALTEFLESRGISVE